MTRDGMELTKTIRSHRTIDRILTDLESFIEIEILRENHTRYTKNRYINICLIH